MGSLLLKDCALVATMDDAFTILRDHDILIEDGRIARIGKRIKPVERDTRKMDCSDRIVMPGLFNGHTHAAMTLLRGYNDDAELHEWLDSVWRVEAKLNPGLVRIGTEYAIMEMLKTGTTCFVDMYFYMEEVVRACTRLGIRSFVGHGMIDLGSPEKMKKETRATKKLVEYARRHGGDLVQPVVAPHAPYTCSRELLEWSRDYSREEGLFLTIHVSETRKEVYDIQKQHGKRPVEYLHELGLLSPRFVGFHSVWLTKREARLLGESESIVVHCPVSNMKLATGGVFPYRELKEAGARILLGTDGPASNNTLDMYREMRVAAILHKWHRWNPLEMTARDVLSIATRGARAFGLETGTIREGMLADLVLLDKNHHSLHPLRSIESNLAYSVNSGAVRDVIITGEVVLENGRLSKGDEEEITREFEKAVGELIP